MKLLIDGKLYDPIKIGDPKDALFGREDLTCHDCGRGHGEYHMSGCDMEVCPACGGQSISCNCGVKYEIDEDISINELREIRSRQIIENMALELEIETIRNNTPLKYKSEKIFEFLAILKITMTKYGVEKDFEDIKNKVFTAESEGEALMIISDYATKQRDKERKNESEL